MMYLPKPIAGARSAASEDGRRAGRSVLASLTAIEQLVNNGTITTTQGHAVDRQVQQGYFDSATLTGFTQPQIQAVERALANAKRALARNVQ